MGYASGNSDIGNGFLDYFAVPQNLQFKMRGPLFGAPGCQTEAHPKGAEHHALNRLFEPSRFFGAIPTTGFGKDERPAKPEWYYMLIREMALWRSAIDAESNWIEHYVRRQDFHCGTR